MIEPAGKALSFEAARSEAAIRFLCNGSWTLRTEPDASAWLTPTPESGQASDKEQSVAVVADENTTGAARICSLILSSGELTISVSIDQQADGPFDQTAANALLAINRFAPFDVASIDEENATVRFATVLDDISSAWVAWNAEWAEKTYTAGGKKYRVPSSAEQLLLSPVYSDDACIHFTGQVDQTYYETLPDDLFGKPGSGGRGKSIYRSGTNRIEVGPDAWAYGAYALRFLGTEQRAAYFYRWYNSGSETDAYLSIRVKALPDDETCAIEDVVDNEAYWSEGFVELKFPACGMNFGGTVMLPGASGDYWSATSGGLNPGPAQSEYAGTFSFTDVTAFLGDANKTNLGNLRLVAVD